MQFAMYLVDNGVLSCEEYYEASKLQQHSRPQLGALAIEARRLTVKQVFAVLSLQCDEPNTRFGELAVRLGYLTDDDISHLLAEQERRATPLLDVLVENDFLSAELAEQHYAEYRRCLQGDRCALATVGA
jgi:hypothetical protein